MKKLILDLNFYKSRYPNLYKLGTVFLLSFFLLTLILITITLIYAYYYNVRRPIPDDIIIIIGSATGCLAISIISSVLFYCLSSKIVINITQNDPVECTNSNTKDDFSSVEYEILFNGNSVQLSSNDLPQQLKLFASKGYHRIYLIGITKDQNNT